MLLRVIFGFWRDEERKRGGKVFFFFLLLSPYFFLLLLSLSLSLSLPPTTCILIIKILSATVRHPEKPSVFLHCICYFLFLLF